MDPATAAASSADPAPGMPPGMKMLMKAALGLAVVIIIWALYHHFTHHTAIGNTGSVPCSLYCSKNWNGEMPKAWKGATAVNQILTSTGKPFLPVTKSASAPVKCVCKRTDSVPYDTTAYSPWDCPGPNAAGVTPPCTLPACPSTVCTS